jgi:hypothetical protein
MIDSIPELFSATWYDESTEKKTDAEECAT